MSEDRMPKGDRLVKSLGPGSLRKGAGKLAVKEGKPIYCGVVSGVAYGVEERSSRVDPTRQVRTFLGKFIAKDWEGTIIRPFELYLPSMMEGAMANMVRQSQAVYLAFEIWAEPSEDSPVGFRYVPRQLLQDSADPALEIAYRAGILEPPGPSQIEGPEEGEERKVPRRVK